MTLEEVRKKLSEIKMKGYIRTLRKGPTGIGYTLEKLLEIKENNLSIPDLGEIELKAKRENHTGMTTLFTLNKKAWKMKPLEAVRKYGRKNKNGRLGLYHTIRLKPNSAGLFLSVKDDLIAVRSTDGSLITEWELEEIQKCFNEKVRSVLLVKARVEKRDGVEHFLYNCARLLSGGATKSTLKNQFENGKLLLDLRLHDKVTRARNHGTGFRAYEEGLEDLYKNIKEIEF